jgi:hypothetical protein
MSDSERPGIGQGRAYTEAEDRRHRQLVAEDRAKGCICWDRVDRGVLPPACPVHPDRDRERRCEHGYGLFAGPCPICDAPRSGKLAANLFGVPPAVAGLQGVLEEPRQPTPQETVHDEVRRRLATVAFDHIVVLRHSSGLVCRCHKVFAGDQEWADHLAEEQVPK